MEAVGVERRRRISAYGLCRDAPERVLLVRASVRSNHDGCWLLPGGGIEHGEDPAHAAVREVYEETGLRAEIVTVRDVIADIAYLTDHPIVVHFDRIIYEMRVRGGTLRDERDGSTDLARWVPRDELAGLPLMAFAAAQFGLPPTPPPAPAPPSAPSAEPAPPAEPRAPASRPGPPPSPPADPRVGQRFAVYGLVTDPAGRVLLTRIATGFPGAGRWHLPGGGTDFGEQPATALVREIAEEADQVGVVTDLISVSHRHSPRAVGPEGYAIDWHSIRALYQVRVDRPTEPRVAEEAGGSTAAAAWFTRAEAARLALTEIAVQALERRVE